MLILALGSRVNEVNQERKYDVAVALDPFYVLRRTRLRSSGSQETDLRLPIRYFALKYCSAELQGKRREGRRERGGGAGEIRGEG